MPAQCFLHPSQGGENTQEVYHSSPAWLKVLICMQPRLCWPSQRDGADGVVCQRDRKAGLDYSAGYLGSAIREASLRWQRGFFFSDSAITPLSQLSLTAPLKGSLPQCLPLRGGAAIGGGEVATFTIPFPTDRSQFSWPESGHSAYLQTPKYATGRFECWSFAASHQSPSRIHPICFGCASPRL